MKISINTWLPKFALCLSLAFSIGLTAQESALDKLEISEIESAIRAIQSATGQFEQIIREQDGYVLDRQTGMFAIERPRKLHWQISELDQLLVGDGQQLYLYDELFEQVIVRDWSSDPSKNPAAILLEDIDLADWASLETTDQSLKLIPNSDGLASILEIELIMNGSFPSLLTLLDATGQSTEIRFSDVDVDIELAPELFEFEIPSGVEVIYED